MISFSESSAFRKAKVNKVLNFFAKKKEYLGKKRKKRLVFLIFSIFLVFLTLFVFNRKTFTHGDDFIYTYFFTTYEDINSISDIIESQKMHYNEWGGRIIVHTVLQALLQLPDIVIDGLNSLIFVVLIVLIYYHVKARGRHSLSLFWLIFFFTWLLQPAFGDTVLWITGSLNYLWATVMVLAFLLPYRFYRGRRPKGAMNILLCAISLFCGIIAGWTNENTVAGLIVMVMSFLFYYRISGMKLPLWGILGLVGVVCGYACMILAPGNFMRAQAEGAELSLLKMVYTSVMATFSLFDYLGVVFLVAAILYVLFIKYSPSNKKNLSLIILVYLFGVLSAIYCMVFSPSYFAPRSWFGVISLAIIVFGVVFYHVDEEFRFIRIIKSLVLVFYFCIFISAFYNAYKDVSRVEALKSEQIKEIESAKMLGKKEVILKKIVPSTKYGLCDAPYALGHMSHYYGITIRYEE